MNLRKTKDLRSLSKLLMIQAEKIEGDGKSKVELIDPVNYEDYHLLHYSNDFQLHWRLHNVDDDSLIRLITISCGRVYGIDPKDNLEYLITFREFSESKLDDRRFTPLDNLPSRLVLNHNELLDIVSTFRYAIEYYENNLPD